MANNNAAHVHWTSRWTFIMAATGSAVGLGNIWKFPYIAGEYGGGAFVLVYLCCIALIGVPVMMAEVLIGRHGQSNPISAVSNIAQKDKASRYWAAIGGIGVITGLCIMMFYSVVAGWALDYVYESARATFTNGTKDSVGNYFTSLTNDPKTQTAWHSVFTLLTISVLAGGVTKGLGNAVRILMPILLVLLLILVGYSYMLGDFQQGVNFLFAFDASKLTGQAVLEAMGHAFFTLSLGMGAIMAYGSYMPRDASIGKTVLTVAFLDTAIALIAGLAIFPLVFANGIEPGAGPGLMFVSLPIAFGNMDSGLIFGTLFFVLVAIAAWSSAVSLLEPSIAWANEQLGMKRLPAAGIVGVIAWSGGVACIYYSELFNFLDTLTTNYLLPLGGLFIAVFAGWKMKRKSVRDELKDLKLGTFNLWYGATRVIAPIGILIIFIYKLGII
jgi:NSS family neurotransmitter:Na+ symporter